MGKPKHPGKKSPYSFHPDIDAYIAQNPDPGFAVPPDLIDKETVEKSMIQLRDCNYAAALMLITLKKNEKNTVTMGWNSSLIVVTISAVLLRKGEMNMTSVSSVIFVFTKMLMQKSIHTFFTLLTSSGTTLSQLAQPG